MKGLCRVCDYVWGWPGSRDDLGKARCPTCRTPLVETAKKARTKASREQVGLDKEK